jgi:hypothetical protein
MPHFSDPESECASIDPPSSVIVEKQLLRPQGNRAAKEEHKNQKLRDAAVHAQLAATKELAEASKRKAEILADQNVLMLFTAPDSENLSQDSREYLQLRHKIELKKLRRQLADEEERERKEVSHAEKPAGATTKGNGADLQGAALAGEHGDQADRRSDDPHDEPSKEDEEGDLQRRSEDLWNSQVDIEDQVDAEALSTLVNADSDTAYLQRRRPPPGPPIGPWRWV